ncbi:MAG: DNA mismatch repair protein MutS [Gallionellaceae bacterium]|nr:MAG: DNA mismatch repair protein MutS [Gallionellaceae bacterium]
MKEKPEQGIDLFRQSLEGVTPLKPSDRINPVRAPRNLVPRFNPAATVVADTLSDHGASEAPASEYLGNGLNRMTLRKLRRGTWPPQDSIDLHGLNSDAARKLLVEFLHHATQNGLRCVNVIHGKGWRSEGREGILKVHTRHWLMQHPQVLAFCEAPQSAGGGGAVWVLLKNPGSSL